MFSTVTGNVIYPAGSFSSCTPFNDAWIQKMTAHSYKMNSETSIRKRSNTLSGRPKTEEHKANLKQAKKNAPCIIFMDEIPKGATGKLQRIGLWDKLVSAGVTQA